MQIEITEWTGRRGSCPLDGEILVLKMREWERIFFTSLARPIIYSSQEKLTDCERISRTHWFSTCILNTCTHTHISTLSAPIVPRVVFFLVTFSGFGYFFEIIVSGMSTKSSCGSSLSVHSGLHMHPLQFWLWKYYLKSTSDARITDILLTADQPRGLGPLLNLPVG